MSLRKNLFDSDFDFRAGQAEMLEEIRAFARGAELVDADHPARTTDVAPPRLRRTRLDRDAARAGSRENAFAIRRGLCFEHFAARHRHEPHALARGLQFPDGFGGEADLRACRD